MRGYRYTLIRKTEGDVEEIKSTWIDEDITDVTYTILEYYGYDPNTKIKKTVYTYFGAYREASTYFKTGGGLWGYLYVTDYIPD